jgi:hypothetical protein
MTALGAALALSACSGGDAGNSEANMDMNAGMTDMNAMDMNAMDMNAMDANMTMNAADGVNATENAMVNDMTTNSPDANLANGM